jgi:hypothetical protein
LISNNIKPPIFNRGYPQMAGILKS